jgi:hypothetical protein
VSVAFSKLSPKQQKLLLAFLEDLGNNKNWWKRDCNNYNPFYFQKFFFKLTNIVKKIYKYFHTFRKYYDYKRKPNFLKGVKRKWHQRKM